MKANLTNDLSTLVGREVFVYRNLHKKCLSVRDVKTRLVVAHVDSINLDTPVFLVNERGRQLVLATKNKNVHAGVRGCLVSFDTTIPAGSTPVTYNPYKYSTFVKVLDLSSVTSGRNCLIKRTGEIYVV